MRIALALLAGRRVQRVYRSARSWNDDRERGGYYVRGLWHGAALVTAALLVLLLLG